MKYHTKVSVGVFWEGPVYWLKPRRWFWVAKLYAQLHLKQFPLRKAVISEKKNG